MAQYAGNYKTYFLWAKVLSKRSQVLTEEQPMHQTQTEPLRLRRGGTEDVTSGTLKLKFLIHLA